MTAILVGLIYTAIAVGQVPGLRMNRATIALAGAALLVVVGSISEQAALHAIDMGTILLLGAMMVVNVNLRMAGFFRFVGSHTLRIAHTPRMLLALVVGSSGVLSAVFLNDPVCLMLTPLVVDLTHRLQRDPIPYLVGLATAANVGSVATITGNPQNLIIGQASGISYLTFLLHLAPVALMGLVVCWGVIILVYPTEFKGKLPEVVLPPPRPYTPLLSRVLLIVAGLMIAFLSGVSIVTAACAAAAILLVSRLRPRKLLALDWDLLAFFAGLFVVTGAIEASGLSENIFHILQPLLQDGVAVFSLVVATLSNIVSNVPAVLLFTPMMSDFAEPQRAWLVLAMASTLAGNLTLLGSAATLIVAEVADQRGVKLSFMAYLRAGIPITILTLFIGILWLQLV
ncbi:MAG: anion transporter [Phototrophicales bacterium]|nr:MAG: anion transporter [Phototrophicales bacterium]RMG71186.1 MAG: anion transporter [Chloroflexota bacterium]